MKVLIVGAGVAGLSLAAHLKKTGHEIVVLERSDKLKGLGFAIGLWGYGLATLKEFGIMEKIREVGHFPTRFELASKAGKALRVFNFAPLFDHGGAAVLLLRSELHKILLEVNKELLVLTETSVDSYDEIENGVSVRPTSGKEEVFDLIVGADGIHSRVRELMFGSGLERFSGLTSWIYVTRPRATARRPHVTEVWAGSKFFGLYPLKNDQLCVFFAKRVPVTSPSLPKYHSEFLREEFGDFLGIAHEILFEVMRDDDTVFHTDWNSVELPVWHTGRAVLVGDAAHATLPTAGAGASMAMEDAFVLSEEINKVTEHYPLTRALESYQHRRAALVKAVNMEGTMIASLIKLDGPLGFIRDLVIRHIPEGLVQEDFRRLMSIKYC